MKNLTFALACASTFALFAEIKAPPAGFEEYEAGAKVANAVEPGSQFTYWLYEGASGSEDGSTVKAYGGDNLAAPTTGDAAGDKYLELSTEGGTLWRSLAEVKQMENGSATLGDAHTIDPEKGLYIDTMVQFTPTEDGGAPDTTGNDKLAIWLNVDSSGVTNLCVKARQVSGANCDGTVDPLGTIYKITNVVPQPGTWYRLTVKAVSDLTSYGGFGGFQIFLDNTVLVADKMTVDGEAYGTLSGDVDICSEEKLALITGKKVFASLVALTELQAVGFKGSGALDNLAITEAEPQPTPGPEFAVNWGESGVTAVWGATPPTAAELAAIQAWATANGLSAAQVAGETGAAAYLLGMMTVPSEVPALSITAIDQTAEGWTVTVACSAQPDLSKVNGKLTVKTATSLGEAWTVQTYDASNLAPADGNSKVVIKITGADARFIKAALTK